MTDALWPAGTASGVGSLPGTDPAAAWGTVLGTVPDFPFVPELPGRGPGADMIGRGLAVCRELPVDLQPSGWRLVARPGRDFRRGTDLLARDLDAAEEALSGYTGPLGIAVCGPWSLAAAVELGRGGPALSDAGAVRDLGDALAEGVAALTDELRSRVPGASVIVSIDEPSLPAVLAGRVPTASGFGTIDAVPTDAAAAPLGELAAAVTTARGVPVAHCCALHAPVRLFRDAGMQAVGLDIDLLTAAELDAVGECIDAGVGLAAGVVHTTPPSGPDGGTNAAVERLLALWGRLGFGLDLLRRSVVVTPTCGVAGVAPGTAREVLRVTAAVAREVVDRSEQQ